MTIGNKQYETKLSSAGLVYRHFGKQVIAKLCGWPANGSANAELDLVYRKTYEDFVEAFDGIDNGIDQYPKDVKPKYRENTNLAKRIGRLAPWWNQESNDEILYSRFLKAVQMAGEEFSDRVRYTGLSWLPARSIVQQTLKDRFQHDPSGRILVFEKFCPWQEHLFDLEEEMSVKEAEKPVYALFADTNGQWRVRAVPLDLTSFDNRKPLPEAWRGIRDEELSKLTGIPGCVFVHASGFIGGNKSREGAMAMAVAALAM